MQGSCYKFSSKALNWTAAKSACKALGSDLVVINSQTEQQALTSQIRQRTWIGMHRDPKDKSRWLWVDGSRPTYTYWYGGEPNSVYEECAEMYPKVHGWKWNDLGCSNSFPYVCETRRGMSVPFGFCVLFPFVRLRLKLSPHIWGKQRFKHSPLQKNKQTNKKKDWSNYNVDKTVYDCKVRFPVFPHRLTCFFQCLDPLSLVLIVS